VRGSLGGFICILFPQPYKGDDDQLSGIGSIDLKKLLFDLESVTVYENQAELMPVCGVAIVRDAAVQRSGTSRRVHVD